MKSYYLISYIIHNKWYIFIYLKCVNIFGLE